MTDLPIYTAVAVADPNIPANVIRPNPDGSINVGKITPDSTAAAIAYSSNQMLQQLVLLNTRQLNALILLLNLVSKPGSSFTLDDLTGDL